MSPADFEAIKLKLRAFAKERDWDQYHSPKNLAMALVAEAGELVERFQWLTEQQSQALSEADLAKVGEEIADIQIYLIRLVDRLGLDLHKEVLLKIQQNERKYPADRVRGSAKKYSEYE